MSVEELITELKKWPGHFTVQAMLVVDDCEKTADFVGVTNTATQKIVSLELDGRLS